MNKNAVLNRQLIAEIMAYCATTPVTAYRLFVDAKKSAADTGLPVADTLRLLGLIP